MATITVNGRRYLIRRKCTAEQLREQYRAFLAKYPGTRTTFVEFINRGGVYNSRPIK